MANSFFKNGDKAYAENLNDGLLVGNAFDWTVTVSLPTDTGAVFPNSSTVVKGKVADCSITPNSNLSIGSTVSNSSGSSQVYRLTVYPAFNRFGGFKSISLTADSGVTFYVANKGASTPIANNLDYTDLSTVPELKVLKEYDIVVSIPTGKSVTGLSFVLQSSSADVSGSIAQSNVTGLSDSFSLKVNVSDIKDTLYSTDTNKPLSAKQGKVLNDSKSDTSHTHDDRYVKLGWTKHSFYDQVTGIDLYYNDMFYCLEFSGYTYNGTINIGNNLLAGYIVPSGCEPPCSVQTESVGSRITSIYVTSEGKIGINYNGNSSVSSVTMTGVLIWRKV